MKQKKYYALCGTDGVGLFPSWELVVIHRSKLKGVNAYAFSTEEEAHDHAYEHLSEIAPLGVDFPAHLEMNKIIYARQLQTN